MYYRIRKINKQDIKKLYEIRKKSSYLSEGFYTKNQIDYMVNYDSLENFKKYLLSKESLSFLLENENEIIGFIGYSSEKEVLAYLFISPNYVGKGYAKKLLDYLTDTLIEKLIYEIKLYSRTNSENFYKRNGFKKIKDHFWAGEEELGIPLVYMSKKIK